MKTKLMILTAAFALAGISTHAEVVGLENFDGGAVNLSSTTNVRQIGTEPGITSSGDAFGFTNNTIGGPFDLWDATVMDTAGVSNFPTDSRGLGGQLTSGFFGMSDPDGGTDDAANNNAVWSFNFGSLKELTSITMDIAAMGDFETASDDGFRIEAQLDSGGYQTIFLGRTNESIDPYTYRAMDDGSIYGENDPLEIFIDGSVSAFGFLDKADPSTGNFDTYTSTVFAGNSATTVDIRLSWEGSPSGSEPMGFDNITINAIPEPSVTAFSASRNGIPLPLHAQEKIISSEQSLKQP